MEIVCQVKGMARANKTETLPEVKLKGRMSLEEAIIKRTSVRNFTNQKLSLEQISQLLWAAYGEKYDAITGASKTVPSGGALYPMEVYLVSPEGVFQYLAATHQIKMVKNGDFRRALSSAALGQSSIEKGAINLVIVCIYERICGKYGKRGIRYAHIEAGHIAQNVHLQAVSLGLGSVPIGAFYDEAVREVLGLPKDYVPLYIIPVGYPRNVSE